MSIQDANSRILGKAIRASLTLATVVVAYGLSTSNYLLFHSLVEFLTVAVAFVMLAIAWNTRPFSANHFLLYLGIGYAFIGSIDLLHALAYRGLGVFRATGANLATQLWIIARFVEALTLLSATAFLTRRVRVFPVILTYLAGTSILLSTVFVWHIFPDCYVEGAGLTPFKVFSEYAISGILLIAIGLLAWRRHRMNPTTFRYLVASMALTVGAELAFTFYVDVYGLSNFVGHMAKLASFALVYMAIVRFTLTRPYSTLFAELAASEEKLDQLARHDPLTGVLNRLTMEEILTRESGRAVRDDTGLTFLMIDVNRFKQINDRYGHQAGDRLLQEIAGLLTAVTRSSDYVFRYGGDEFLIVVCGQAESDDGIVDRIRNAVTRRNEAASPSEVPLSLAMGIERFRPQEDGDIDAALDRADQKMYQDKPAPTDSASQAVL